VSGIVYRRLQLAMPAAREQVRIEIPSLNGDSTLIGAAETAFSRLLDDPMGTLATSRHATDS